MIPFTMMRGNGDMTGYPSLQITGVICGKTRAFLEKVRVLTMALVLLLGSVTYADAGQSRPLEALREEFQRRAAGTNASHSNLAWILGVVAVVITVVILVSWVVNYFQQRRPYFSYTLLFLELSWVHKLKLKDILLLWRWTSQERIRPRAQIFVDPGLWQDKINPVLAAAGSPIHQTEWDRLYARLFGTLVLSNAPADSTGTSAANRSDDP